VLPPISSIHYKDSSRFKFRIALFNRNTKIVKKYVEMQNGSIRVESEPGIGSSFILELPSKTFLTEND
jgi:light-regulated signal transduction histidine kinase (bacteriophytochrome)